MEDLDVWHYYEKCEDDGSGDKKATCQLCLKPFCYTTTITNLKNHLLKLHDIAVPRPKADCDIWKKSKKSNRNLWIFFNQTDESDKHATCNACGKILSYRTTTANLKSHLKKIHPKLFEKLNVMQNTSDGGEDYFEFEYEEVLDEDFEQSSEDDEPLKTSEDIGSYFERESGGRARCAVCRHCVPNRDKALRDHLRGNHPKLLPESEQELEDQDDSMENDTYTEVVYLEDPITGKSPEERPKANKRKRIDSYKERTPRHRSPKPSNFAAVQDKPKKTPEEEEWETFGTYITCLLKTLPKDVCTAVQRDVINIIMNAKLGKVNNPNVVVEGHHVTPVTILKTVSFNKDSQSMIMIPNSEVSIDKTVRSEDPNVSYTFSVEKDGNDSESQGVKVNSS